MKTNQKILAMVTMAALAVTPLMGSTAFALSTWTLSTTSTDRTWNMPTNDSTWTNAKIISVTPSDTTILTTTLNGTTSFTVNPLKEGSTNVTITYYTTNVAETKTQIQPITVSNSTTASSVTFTTLNTDQTPIGQMFTGLGTIVSQNTNVAQVSLNASGQLVIRSVGAGSTRVVGTGQTPGGNSYAVDITVNVNTATTGTTSTAGVIVNGTNVTIPKGQSWQIPGTFYTITGSSSATNIATAVPSGSTGSMTLTINGVAPGTSTITGTKLVSATSAYESFTYNITVTDGTTTGTTSTFTGTKLAAMTLNAGNSRTTAAGTFAQVDATSVKSENSAIATAEVVGTQVKVKGVSAGTTNIGFKAQTTGGTMTDYVIPVTVTGTASTGSSVGSGSSSSAYEIGDIIFKKDEYTLAKSTKSAYVLKGMTMEGETVLAKDLLWVSNNTSVVSVNSKTGTFRVLKNTGSARLIAVDPDGEYIGSVIINAK